MTAESADNGPSAHGTAIHRAVALAIAEGVDSGAALSAIVRRVLAQPSSGRLDRASYISVLSGASAYLARGHPGSSWHLLGSEVRLGRAIADLVFLSGPGLRPVVLVDELKTGMTWSALSSPRTIDQLERLLVGARETWGDGLIGVRLVAPTFRFSFLVRSQDDLLRLKGLDR